QVLLAGEQVVDGRELAGDADRGADRVGVAGEVVAGDPDLAGVGADQVERIWTMVVLPAPLGPSSAKIVPSATSSRCRRARGGRRTTCAGRWPRSLIAGVS